MPSKPKDPDRIPKDVVILQPHWQYVVKWSGVQWFHMCFNGSKKAVPQLHTVASTWSSYIELPVHGLFFGLHVDISLTIYGGDATDTYTYSSAPTDAYLAVDDIYAKWYYNKYKKPISKQMVLPVEHNIHGHLESSKIWIQMIDKIFIEQLGFITTTHDCCIYIREQDD